VVIHDRFWVEWGLLGVIQVQEGKRCRCGYVNELNQCCVAKKNSDPYYITESEGGW